MSNTLEKIKGNAGFSLVEMAIAMVVIGVLLVPALHGYKMFLQQERVKETDLALLEARNAIGDFRAMYGRYPCPARADLNEDDADYGRESRAGGFCTEVAGLPNAPGVIRVNSNRAADANFTNTNVFIGSLPFRQMNLPEEYSRDGQGARLTYVVTEMLTREQDFAVSLGGITLNDVDGLSITDTPHTGHFAVISHGLSNEGAISREGFVMGTCPNPALITEGENCDRDDATFVVGSVEEGNFDDIVHYNVTDGIEPWQLQATNEQNIHLLSGRDSFVIGSTNPEVDTTGFAQAEILEFTVGDDTGTMAITRDLATPNTGKALTPAICDESGTNCFHPHVIAGTNDTTNPTIYCDGVGDPGGYLIGIEGGKEKCATQLFFSCPDGTFVSGFDSNGQLVCSAQPPAKCPTQDLTTTCGPVRTVDQNDQFFYKGKYRAYTYSGDYYEIASLNTSEVEDIIDDYAPSEFADAMTALRTYLDDNYNDVPRTHQEGGPTQSDALIRDTFTCESGVWDTTPTNTLERLNVGTNLASFSADYSGGSYPAETSGPAYNPAAPMSVDSNNSDNYRDCWCREDYRVVTTSCGGALAGSRFRIDRHNCPRTSHGWDRVYPSSASYNTAFCGCSPGTSYSSTSCKAHFGYSGPGIIGNVTITNAITCPSGPSGSPSVTPTAYDISNCACPDLADQITTDACPVGTTNSFSYGGVNYTGVNKIYVNSWSCPGGPPPQPAISAADAGSWSGSTLVHTEPCNCDSTLTQLHVEACPSGYQGSGKTYLLPYNCATGTYDDPSPANLQDDDCNLCIWQAGTQRPGIQSAAAPVPVNAACPSCSGNSSCYQTVGVNQYKVWDGCYCAGQP